MKTISDICNLYYDALDAENKYHIKHYWDHIKNKGKYVPFVNLDKVDYLKFEIMLHEYAKEKYSYFTDAQINEIRGYCYEHHHANYEEYICQFGKLCDFIHDFLQIK